MNNFLLSPEPNKESIDKIANEETKPWYKKPEIWFGGIIANILAIIAILIAVFKK